MISSQRFFYFIACMLMFPLVPACNRNSDPVWWENEREKIELAKTLELLKYRHAQIVSREENLVRFETTLRELAKRQKELIGNRSSLAAEVKAMELKCDELSRMAFQKKRLDAVGNKFETFSLKDGRIYQDVTITAVDDSGVALRHQHGTAKLRFAALSPEQREFFALEESSALKAENNEMQRNLAYEREIEQGMEALREADKATLAAAKSDKELAERERALYLARAELTYRNRPLAKPPTQVGNGSWSWRGWNSYRYYYRPSYRRNYYYPSSPWQQPQFTSLYQNTSY